MNVRLRRLPDPHRDHGEQGSTIEAGPAAMVGNRDRQTAQDAMGGA